MVLSPLVFLHSRSMHSGLLFSMPMTHFGMPVYCLSLIHILNVDPGSFAAAVAEKLSALPRVSGSGRDPDKVYISQIGRAHV